MLSGRRRRLGATLADDEHALATAVEEVIRYRSPVQGVTRVVRTPVELGGASLPVAYAGRE